ncbi:MAG: hypothetical protein RDV41_05320 [Planctomycetota bacterium]|nr:hypothetical protein [Planctomycetota bacterium]
MRRVLVTSLVLAVFCLGVLEFTYAQEPSKPESPASDSATVSVQPVPKPDGQPGQVRSGGGPNRQKAVEGALGALLLLLSVPANLGLLLLVLTLSPTLTERIGTHVKAGRFRSFLFGLPVIAILVILTALTQGRGVLITGPVLLVFLIWGLVALSEDVGRRVLAFAGKDLSRPLRILVGWPVIGLACCVPVAGWFIVAPAVICIACGGFLQALFNKNGVANPVSPAEVKSPAA